MYPCLQGLTPAAFFHWFGRIAQIPHGSRKEQALAAFLQEFAAQRGIPCEADEAGNLLMRLPATAGYESQPAILFQAHMDMVWDKEPDCDFNFDTQPLRLQVEGDRLFAQGTTLGADNAVGMATMLALADDPSIPRPALELLFTAAEEVGMLGVRAFDASRLQARRMINMDCGDSHVLCVSSAGKADTQLHHSFALETIPAGFSGLQVELSGGLGGHPGLEANKSRCCCGNAMGDLLTALAEFHLVSLTGSSPIMPRATATIAAAPGAEAILRDRFRMMAQIYAQTDPGLTLTLTPCQLPEKALSAADSQKAALALTFLRSGQFRADGNDPRYVVTSGALLEMQLEAGAFALKYRLRSTSEGDQQLHLERLQASLRLLGMTLSFVDGYAGWVERKDSPFRDKFLSIHKALFGYDMDIERCSGGIESGILTSQIPDMDTVGIAPTARGAHTPKEYLQISEAAPYWQLMLAVLAAKE